MKGKAIDICNKCKHCEGLDMFAMFSCKHFNNYPDAAIGVDCEIECDNFEEVNMNKIEGKVSEFCPKCKNCKGTTRESNGVHVWLTEVECEDPHDGMVKILDADSDICCSMFEPKPDRHCKNCERFDGTYCHGSDGTISISYKALFGEPVNCPSYEEKKEKDSFNLNMPREALEAKILDLFEEKNRLNGIINSLEKEKAAHLKGIERLKKSQEKLRTIHQLEKEKADHLKDIERLKKSQEKLQNQVKNLQTTNEESYKREKKLEDKCYKLERRLLEENKRFDRLDTEFLIPLSRVLYPREAKICKPYSEVLKDIKLLNKGVYDLEEDNKRLAEKNKELRENCHKAEADVTTLNSKVETLKNKNDKYLKWNHTMESYDGLIDEIDKLKNENTSLNTINKGLAEDRKKLINYMRSLKIASENYLKEFTYEED